jgi:hypothetical protein
MFTVPGRLGPAQHVVFRKTHNYTGGEMKKFVSVLWLVMLLLVVGVVIAPSAVFANWNATFVWQENIATDLDHYVILQDGVEVSGNIPAGTLNYTISNLVAGTYNITLRTYDQSQNYSETPAVVLNLDEVPPGVTPGFELQILIKTP